MAEPPRPEQAREALSTFIFSISSRQNALCALKDHLDLSKILLILILQFSKNNHYLLTFLKLIKQFYRITNNFKSWIKIWYSLQFNINLGT